MFIFACTDEVKYILDRNKYISKRSIPPMMINVLQTYLVEDFC